MVSEAGLSALLQQAAAAHQRAEWEAAERDYRAVLAARPEQPDATHFLGLLLHQRGRSEAALPFLDRALVLQPNNHLYRANLAGVLKQLGRPVDAEHLYREALELRPDYLEGYLNLGMLYADEGDHPRALAAFEEALRLDPDHYTAWYACARSLQQLARVQASRAAFRMAAALADRDPERLQALSVALREAGEIEEAARCQTRALELAPDSPQAENGTGNVLAMHGDLAGAELHYRRALALKPAYPSAFHNLMDVVRLKPNDPLWPVLMALAERAEALPPEEAVPLHFALARAWDAEGETGKAFAHLTAGNRLKRAGIHYDETRQARFFRDFIDGFPALAAAGSEDERPVFIVGMPRSGTSLVEQILASHPAVYGAGETHALRNCLREELPPDPGDHALPHQLAKLDAAALGRVAGRYSRYLGELAPGAARVTNKLPGNMVFVGLIRRLYPKARIVHCLRDPLDTCYSLYARLFTTGHPFSYELGELGRFHRMYRQLMADWSRLLPEATLPIVYEDLVVDLETGARRLVAHCGLPWDEACLRFHAARRPVRTASLAQVRQPVYTSAVGRWRRYEKELAPLKAALETD
ncbi:MAG TPA: sulfotransferase [Gammaproteobacteria bacterium]|nr:sulfotransferase [Gammaproteobacteria bacterium]